MPFDIEKVGEVLVSLVIASAILLVAVGITWRLVMKPTLRALLEYRAARNGGDPVLARRVGELEESVRALNDRMAALPEGNPVRRLGADVPLRGTREKA